MVDLTLYTNPMSRGRIARWMMEEIGEPYETIVLDYGAAMKAPDYLKLNPMGKVPTLRHRDLVITEAAAICAYLADAFPEKGLAPPPSDPRRAPYYRWMFFAAGPVESAVTNKSLGLESDRKQTLGYGSFEDTVNTLEQAVSAAPFICGDKFTAADVYVGAQVSWGLMFKTMPERPAFAEYAARVQARPAYKSATKLDDALMPEQQS